MLTIKHGDFDYERIVNFFIKKICDFSRESRTNDNFVTREQARLVIGDTHWVGPDSGWQQAALTLSIYWNSRAATDTAAVHVQLTQDDADRITAVVESVADKLSREAETELQIQRAIAAEKILAASRELLDRIRQQVSND